MKEKSLDIFETVNFVELRRKSQDLTQLFIELIEISVLLSEISLSPIKDDRPLPKPFLDLKGFIMLHSPLVCLGLKIHQ